MIRFNSILGECLVQGVRRNAQNLGSPTTVTAGRTKGSDCSFALKFGQARSDTVDSPQEPANISVDRAEQSR